MKPVASETPAHRSTADEATPAVTAAVVFREQPIAEASHDQDKDDSHEERHHSTYRPFSRSPATARKARSTPPPRPASTVHWSYRCNGFPAGGEPALRSELPSPICGSLRPSGPVRRHLMAAGRRALMGRDEAWQSQRCHSKSGAGVFDAGSNLKAWTTTYGPLAAALSARYAPRISSPTRCTSSSRSRGTCTSV
jgi:hypothetical protein